MSNERRSTRRSQPEKPEHKERRSTRRSLSEKPEGISLPVKLSLTYHAIEGAFQNLKQRLYANYDDLGTKGLLDDIWAYEELAFQDFPAKLHKLFDDERGNAMIENEK